MSGRKKQEYTHEFIGEGGEELIDIFRRQFVRFVNQQKGYTYLSLKSDLKTERTLIGLSRFSENKFYEKTDL